ncbi:hypothetical protein C1H46_021644 [Malus baccata]|uniref:Uncharacterized protein n=1 Tax=Malus baccata TaxID=106549 RepID=A0A540M244_MALBA|nr:hypothetical protein C1H46_021644 [Malus baccata]
MKRLRSHLLWWLMEIQIPTQIQGAKKQRIEDSLSWVIGICLCKEESTKDESKGLKKSSYFEYCNKWPKIRQKRHLQNSQIASFVAKCSERIRKWVIYVGKS